MGTQGLISVVAKADNQVMMKVIAGVDGQLAKVLADEIRKRWPMAILDVYHLALDIGFGTEDSLVVMTEKIIHCAVDSDLPSLYFETFSQPEFNPQWKHGTADYTEIIYV